MEPAGAGALRDQGVVLLHAQGPQVSQRLAPEPRRRERVLEGHRRRQARRAQGPHPRDQEGARVLRREGAERGQDRLDHARVPTRRRRTRRRRCQKGITQVGRLGAVPALQQEERVGEDADGEGGQGGGLGHGHLPLPLAVALPLLRRDAHAGVRDRRQRPVPGAQRLLPGLPGPRRRGAAADDVGHDGAQEGGRGRGRPSRRRRQEEQSVRRSQLRRHTEHVQRPRHDAAGGRLPLLLILRVAAAQGHRSLLSARTSFYGEIAIEIEWQKRSILRACRKLCKYGIGTGNCLEEPAAVAWCSVVNRFCGWGYSFFRFYFHPHQTHM